MLGPLNIVLSEFDVSPRNGFLPDSLPLLRLPDPYYEGWEEIVHQLPLLLEAGELRSQIDRLHVLSTSRFGSEEEWKRAYLLLSFMTHAYIWGGEQPAERLPPAITIPFLDVASHLGLPPTATYSALNLWNFTAANTSKLSEVDNLSILHTFTGTADEAWFYLVSVAIEARGAEIIPVMLEAMDAVRVDGSNVVTRSLLQFSDMIQDLGVILRRMYEHCDPDVFYNRIRPFLAGSKGMAMAGLPNGVFYDEGDGKGQWREYSGGSNAQSSLIQFFDVVLEVEHLPTRTSKTEEPRNKAKSNFIQKMRDYMPGSHRKLLQQIECQANIRDYVKISACNNEMTAAYNLAVTQLAAFRDIHMEIIHRYILVPSRKAQLAQTNVMNLAIASTNKEARIELSGTGGTELVPFLKQSRKETIDTALS